ncbi:hypothetical protein FPZ43_11225 [Mucilaginibacter pallidiroseus]|uniref:SbsA Ig-like domain-containing protein n=1 Tax=Mucilaginibacter pallidiroseus TaxID=2599295 RepID=A0A563UBX1_9SPHI|nr:Ig-like domain-containing protein [Mucilaginibacter pallidiroseus]TWR28834.1 hypothetical protein FPZ43_11225 [Mucilaginibacter pallidiroseus]
MKKGLMLFTALFMSAKVFSSEYVIAPKSHNPQPDTCKPTSTLSCADVKVALPFSLSFDTPASGTILDKNGLGTGFRTVNTYSGARLSEDGQTPIPGVPGYDPSKITLAAGRLQIVANKGIDYLKNNNQLNLLGVQIQSGGKLQLDVKVINPYNGTQSQQAGIWFGLNDKTYIKLGVTGNKVELRKEYNDISSTTSGSANPDQRITGVISGLNTNTVWLRLLIDSVSQTAEGFYSTNGSDYTSSGKTGYTNASVSTSEMGITSGTVYAGLFASYRNGTNPVTYTFDDFSIQSVVIPPFHGCAPISTLPCASLQINLPLALSFDQPIGGTINDKNSQGTGFTTVNTLSGTRNAADGQLSVKQIPGYEPSKIKLAGGQLQLVANKGIDYLTNNNQLNLLGVQVAARGRLQLDVKVIKPYNGTQSQQAGLWYGLNDKTYIKLGITGNKVELRRELNDISSTVVGSLNPDQRITNAISGLNTDTVSLRLVIDSLSQTAEGFYSTNGTTYTSTGKTGYARPGVDISGMGVTSTIVTAGIFASYRNGTSPVNYYFDDFAVSDVSPTQRKLSFSKDTLNFTVIRSGQVIPQSVNLITTPATLAFTLTKTEASWLSLPSNPTSTLTLGAENINAAVPPGNYQALITGTADGYTPASLLINLNVIEGINNKAINVNFQAAQTVPPVEYVVDYGQAYGERTSTSQSVGLVYGWRKRTDNTPINLIGNGRLRTLPEDILLATLFHMQPNHIPGNFSGIKTEGYWELKVPNGTYDATVSVGDGTVSSSPEIHTLNIEGVNAINQFVPKGKAGDIGRFSSNTIRVTVADENLTIDADGGTNTKINFASIIPVTTAPYLYWAAANQNITIEKGTTLNKSFSVVLGSSDNLANAYSVTATYTTNAAPWLTFNSSPSGIQPAISFNYSSANALPLGTYYAKIKATSGAYSSATFTIQLNVVDGTKPYVISSNPSNASINVSLTTVSIAANNLHVPPVEGFPGGVDNASINDTTVVLYKYTDTAMEKVLGTVQGTGGGDAISFSPKSSLEANTRYKFVITSNVKSYSGAAFAPFEATFTTDAAKIDSSQFLYAQFKKVAIPGTQNIKYSSLTFGPDNKFYALRLNGIIERYDVNHDDGSLSNKKTISTLYNKYGERTAIGLAFDPRSTSSHNILWVTHSSGGFANAPAFDGNISRLEGDSLQIETLMVTKLPRSTRDHMVNSLAFGPDSALYFCQGSNSSAGEYDNDWQRKESLLAGTVMRLDINKLNGFSLPLNVQTSADQAVINSAPAALATMSDGTYNPYGIVSPLTIYASGVRNAYDLVWHSNGQLYVPTNGSGGGGNSPASVNGTRRPDGTFYNGPMIPATNNIKVQDDWLFRVNPEMPVGYYGHPNPLRGEYVINRGYADNPLYSPAIVADTRYRPAFDFGLNHSPNGALEYKSSNFNGALKGKLLVCRFSGGGDIIVLELGSSIKIDSAGSNGQAYDIIKSTTGSGNMGLVGMSGFTNPLDIVEDVTNGNLYVIEYNWNDNTNLTGQITLLKAQDQPIKPMGVLAVAASPEITDSKSMNKSHWITIMNKGEGILKVKSIQLYGEGAPAFKIAGVPLPTNNEPLALQKNSALSFRLNVTGKWLSRAMANLRITTVEDSVKELHFSHRTAAIDTPTNEVTKTTGYTEVSKTERKLLVYPNPSNGAPIFINLKNFNKNEAVSLLLYDGNGRLLKTIRAVTDLNGEFNTTFTIEKQNESGSFYIVRAVYASGSKYAKLIVTR